MQILLHCLHPSAHPACRPFSSEELLTFYTAPFDYDAALMACARGDRTALQQLYQCESRYLMGVALCIVRRRQQAEDVLHDAFISIWQRAASFNPALGEGLEPARHARAAGVHGMSTAEDKDIDDINDINGLAGQHVLGTLSATARAASRRCASLSTSCPRWSPTSSSS